jgi:hypothetical protein
MRIGSIFLTAVVLLLSLTGIATTTTADQLIGSVTVSLAPGGASLTSTSGTWIWGPATAASLDCPGCYQLNLNGARNGTGNAIQAEIANGGQLYAYNPGGWYVWNGSWVWVMDAPTTPEKPGPSVQLFNNPYYTCATNYYVATTGNDSNDGTSPSTPWLNLQHANNSLPTGGKAAGSCINVAPGAYASGVSITAGGNLASSTGYVVYRCTTMDACTVTDVHSGGQNGTFVLASSIDAANYIWIDGFTLAAASLTNFGQGLETIATSNTYALVAHHVWMTNNIIYGYGQAGIQMNEGEYYYAIHNTVYNNGYSPGCAVQGSGISMVWMGAVPGYTRTPDDSSNSVLGNIGSFNNAIEWNVLYNNTINNSNACGTGDDTDGNNIIMDTNNGADAGSGGPPAYPGSTLIAFNVTYDSGGRGIWVFLSDKETVANNSCYNTMIDSNDSGGARPCIGTQSGYGNTYINNLSYQITGSNKPLSYNNAYQGDGNGGTPDTFTANLSYCLNQPTTSICNGMYNGAAFSCTSNKCNTLPGWMSVGNTSTGTATTQPVGANFALQSGSPAIGYGLTETYLSPQSIDAGACYHTLASCP